MPTLLVFEAGKEKMRKVGTYEITKFCQDLKKKRTSLENNAER